MAIKSAPEAKAPNAAPRRVNALAAILGAERYLEIGVYRGKTFFEVDIGQKVGVDVKFRFDVGQRPPNERFYEMTSDEWFLRCDDSEKFDVIFLDGLHTFEQTFRDFCNSMSIAHAGTVWLLDDTVPTSLYSAWPNYTESLHLRKLDRNDVPEDEPNRAWHGDVYKIVFAIHDFFPRLSYRTIFSGGKRQTVVWRQPRDNFCPIFDSMRKIATMSYLDFRRSERILRPAPERDVLAEIAAFFENRSAPSDKSAGTSVAEAGAPSIRGEMIADLPGGAPKSTFEQSDALAVYELASEKEQVKLVGGLQWSEPLGVSLAEGGAIMLDESAMAPASLLLSGKGVAHPFDFCDMTIKFDGYRLGGRTEIDQERNWTFAGTTIGGAVDENVIGALSIAGPVRSQSSDHALTLERISVFASGRAPSPNGSEAPAGVVFDVCTEPGTKGWHTAEALRDGGLCWMGRRAECNIRLKRSPRYSVSLPEVRPLTSDIMRGLQITLGGIPLDLEISQLAPESAVFRVFGRCALPDAAESLVLRFSFPDECVRSPRDAGINNDLRQLTIALRKIACTGEW